MTSGKHSKAGARDNPFRDDRERNPGIGRSKGTFATSEPPDGIAANSTIEGDTENETTRQGGIDPNKLGRTNR